MNISNVTNTAALVKYIAIPYLTEYENAPLEIITAFDTQRLQFAEYSDQWGVFRSVFIPIKSKDGMLYIAAANIEISNIQSLMQEKLIENVLNSLLFLFLMLLLLFVYYWQIK
jgi:hypothetical protein